MARRPSRTRSRGGRKDQTAASAPSHASAEPDGTVRRRRPGDDPGACELCERTVDRFTVHHLIPRARGGNHGPTALLCPTCHRQVHAMFSVTTLAEEMYSVDLLRSNPRVADFLRWMRKQRGASFRVRRSRERG